MGDFSEVKSALRRTENATADLIVHTTWLSAGVGMFMSSFIGEWLFGGIGVWLVVCGVLVAVAVVSCLLWFARWQVRALVVRRERLAFYEGQIALATKLHRWAECEGDDDDD